MRAEVFIYVKIQTHRRWFRASLNQAAAAGSVEDRLRNTGPGGEYGSGYVGYTDSREKWYGVSETGKGGENGNQAKMAEQAEMVFYNRSRWLGAAGTRGAYHQFWPFHYLSGWPNLGFTYYDGETRINKPAYYAFAAVTHNLSDTITVSEMTTGATSGSYDLPTGYEGYLFKTDTITRAVVWKDTTATKPDLEIEVSGTGSDYVRIARSTEITQAEVSGIGADHGGIGWAVCEDNGECWTEDRSGGSGGTTIWPSTWDDLTGNDGKYKLDDAVLEEPIMIWSDTGDITITW